MISVLPLALPLTDVEPLHGAAVGWDGGALLLLGRSGWGKSSLAAALSHLGHGFLADDACALDGEGMLWPGPPLLGSRIGSDGHPVVASYDGKTVVAPPGHDPEPRPAAGVLILSPEVGSDLGVRPLAGREALTEVLRHARAPRLFTDRRRGLQLKTAARLSRLPAGRVTYDPARHGVGEAAGVVAEWADRK